jgi:hypothetical protein
VPVAQRTISDLMRDVEHGAPMSEEALIKHAEWCVCVSACVCVFVCFMHVEHGGPMSEEALIKHAEWCVSLSLSLSVFVCFMHVEHRRRH